MDAARMERLATALLAVVGMALVVWVRTAPLGLAGVDGLADRAARYRVGQRVVREAGTTRLTPRELEARLNRWVAEHPTEFARERETVAAGLREDLQYEAPGGERYVYLGHEDSYTWLRLARNYLTRGTVCDAVVDGECRDTYADAPWGMRMPYDRSVHIAAIVALQRLVTVVRPDYPLPMTSFWVPVIVGALAVLPAFGIGRLLAGVAGGIAGALLVGLNPIFLTRSVWSDNDVWNIALPLWMVWALLRATASGHVRGRIGWTLLAVLSAVLHGVTWSGWVGTFAVALVALAAALVFDGIGWAVAARSRPRRGAGAADWAAAAAGSATIFVVFAVTTFAVAGALGANPGGVLSLLWPVAAPVAGGAEPAVSAVWPDVLATVAELREATLGTIIAGMYGAPFVFAGLVGLVLLWLPRSGWRWVHIGLAGIAVAAASALVGSPAWTVRATVGVAALPVLLAAAVAVWEGRPGRAERFGAIVVGVWLLAGLYVGFGGDRFRLFLVPGLGLAAGIAVGLVFAYVTGWCERLPVRLRLPGRLLAAVAVAGALVVPVRDGYRVSRAELPTISDAWWGILTRIRDESAPDAIVNTWWDYGYWVKYVAERRVTADGATLLTHLPYWLGRTLVSATETEAVGLLRMLNCGSDGTPLPEGRFGAYQQILATVGDPIRAQGLVVELASLDRPAAAARLDASGFVPATRDAVLAATHCTPPETFLIIGTEMTRKDSWMRIGAWDFTRAFIADRAGRLPRDAAVTEFTRRFGYGADQARLLYDAARTTPRADFVIGPAPRAPSIWYPCRRGTVPGQLACPLGLNDTSTNTILEQFVYDATDPGASRFVTRRVEPGRGVGPAANAVPGAVLVAASDLRDVPLAADRYAAIGVVVDLVNQRVLVGPPPFIRSIFAQLLFLDGRYAVHFEKFDDRVAYTQDHVVAWRVRF